MTRRARATPPDYHNRLSAIPGLGLYEHGPGFLRLSLADGFVLTARRDLDAQGQPLPGKPWRFDPAACQVSAPAHFALLAAGYAQADVARVVLREPCDVQAEIDAMRAGVRT